MISVPVGLVILVVVLALVEIPAWRRFKTLADEVLELRDKVRVLRDDVEKLKPED